MSRCIEFYEKWQREPNWCEKCPSAVSQINSYIELVETLEQKGVPKDFTFVNLTETASRPLFSEKNHVVRQKAVEKICNNLNSRKGAGRGHKKKLTTGDVKKIINTIKTEIQPPSSIPVGKYNIILADPPWKYDFSISDNRQIENQYPTMELDEICKLPVPAANGSVLFLWTPMPKLLEALKVIEAWGFEYKSGMVWVKDKIGMGYYCRNQHELLLIAAKGKLPLPLPENRPPSVLCAPRTEHSAKPEAVYEIIEKMYPGCKYLEMFARQKRNGWFVWGNQI